MTITESLTTWLTSFDGGLEVDGAHSSDQLASIAIVENMYEVPEASETGFLDGSHDATVYRQVRVRQSAQTERLRDPAWLEQLERWVRTRNLIRELPVLDAGRVCGAVHIVNAYYVQTEEDATYQLNVSINYYEEAEQ